MGPLDMLNFFCFPNMIIRRKQIQAFDDHMRNTFIDRMVVHLNRFFPDVCRSMEGEELRQVIDIEIKHAKRYGFVAERDCCKFIDVAFALGRDFDQDPEYGWAGEILRDEEIIDPHKRADRLAYAAIDYLNKENIDVQ